MKFFEFKTILLEFCYFLEISPTILQKIYQYQMLKLQNFECFHP